MILITFEELQEMAQTIIDEETQMTALDLWEWENAYSDYLIVNEED